MVNYYYYRMSILFGVLFAMTWMQLSRADPTENERIERLETSLKLAYKEKKVPTSGFNHLASWDSWEKLPKDFKILCADCFNYELEDAGIEYTSGDKGKLAEMAHEVLGQIIKISAAQMKALFADGVKLKGFEEGVDRMVKAGKFIHMNAAFSETFGGDSYGENAVELAKNIYPNMGDNAALCQMMNNFFTDYLAKNDPAFNSDVPGTSSEYAHPSERASLRKRQRNTK